MAAAKYDGRLIRYTDLDQWFADLRRGELAGVPYFHRLAPNIEAMREVRNRIEVAGIIVLELDTGRRTDNPKAYADMVDEARDFNGRLVLSKVDAERYGRMGGEKSPATKSRGDRLPNEHAERILNNRETYPTAALALTAINNARRADGTKFPRKWNSTHISRMSKKGKITIKPRRAGARVKL